MVQAEIGQALIRAAVETLRPLVRRLLAFGIPFGHLEASLRPLFVEIAAAEFGLPGRRQTNSRIALLTGINRKEVRRIRVTGSSPTQKPTSFSRNQAAGLISRWMTDPRTTDSKGRPRPIPYQSSRGPSFVKLAQQITVDLPARAILDELVRRGAAEIRRGDIVALRGDTYVPRSGQAEKLAMLAEDPAELIETMLRNTFSEGGDLLLQRKVAYDNIGSEGAERIRSQMRREGERLLRRMNRLLSMNDRDRNPRAPGGDRRYVAVGLYCFESPEKPTRSVKLRKSGVAKGMGKSHADEA